MECTKYNKRKYIWTNTEPIDRHVIKVDWSIFHCFTNGNKTTVKKVGFHHKKSDLRAHMMPRKFFVFPKYVEEIEHVNCSIPEIRWILSRCGTFETLKTWQRGRILCIFSGRINNLDWALRMVGPTFTLSNILTKALPAWKIIHYSLFS
jgi:hypothetical protein